MLRDIAVVRNRKKLNGERLKKHRVALELSLIHILTLPTTSIV